MSYAKFIEGFPYIEVVSTSNYSLPKLEGWIPNHGQLTCHSYKKHSPLLRNILFFILDINLTTYGESMYQQSPINKLIIILYNSIVRAQKCHI